MYISEQLLNPSEARLRLSAQLGVEHVVLDNRGTELVSTAWDAKTLRDYRRWVEGFGLELDVFALDVASILLDSLVDLASAKKSRNLLAPASAAATAARCAPTTCR
jgi:mannonate dehydratase